MIHFIGSIILLALVAIALLGYVVFFRYALKYSFGIFSAMLRWRLNREIFFPGGGFWRISKNQMLSLGMICVLICLCSYTYERNRWGVKGSAYPAARNYFLTGMVLLEYRTVGAVVFAPERAIWKPTLWLQRLISAVGETLIQEDDAERAIWDYFFELAPYINRIHAPRTPEVYHLIDTSEYVLERLVSSKIHDIQFREKFQFIIYPLVGLYYGYTYKGRYFLRPQPKRYYEGFHKDPGQYERLKEVVDWMLLKESEWQNHPLVQEHFEENPDIELVHLAAVIILLHDIVRYQVHNLIYTCDDRYVNLYHKYVGRYTSAESPYYRVDRTMQKRLDSPVIYHGATHNFIGHTLCGFPKLKGYNIRSARDLSGDGMEWYKAYLELNKKLVEPEKQQENLIRGLPVEAKKRSRAK